MSQSPNRLIGCYEGTEQGPLFICLGAMHGNEPAGVKAIDIVLKMLEVEPIRNPGFVYRGVMVGLIGNRKAYEEGKRFIAKDLNRNFDKNTLVTLRKQIAEGSDIDSEDQEFLELDTEIRQYIKQYQPSRVVLLDLHTTSSHGGIFTICRDNQEDIDIAAAMHAPIVLGMLKGLKGTTLHYFTTDNMGIDTIPITFESGQHVEGLSVNRAVAGIINCMKAIEAVEADVVENHHEQILIEYSKNLPRVTEMVLRHGITDEDDFDMKPGYTNFQSVTAGEIIAVDKSGPIAIPEDGHILMPLYQQQGEDGYFLVKDVS